MADDSESDSVEDESAESSENESAESSEDKSSSDWRPKPKKENIQVGKPFYELFQHIAKQYDESAEPSEDNSDFESRPKIKKKKIEDIKPFHDLMQYFAKLYGKRSKITKNRLVTGSRSEKMKVNQNDSRSSQPRTTGTIKRYLCWDHNMAFSYRDAVRHRSKEHSYLPKYKKLYEAILVEKNTKAEKTADTVKRHLCRVHKMAFTYHGASKHKSKEHSGSATYRSVYEAIIVKMNTGADDKPKRVEEKTEKRKRPVPDETTQVSDESEVDDEQNEISQDGREKDTHKKMKRGGEKEVNEKPLILKCNQCGLNFVKAKSIDKHFKECQNESKNSVECGVCKMAFTKDELICHLMKHHVNNKYKEFNILTVSNASLVEIRETNERVLKENLSPLKNNINIAESSEDEFEPKINLLKTSQQDLNKRTKLKMNRTQQININKSQTSITMTQEKDLNQKNSNNAYEEMKKNLNTPPKISVQTKDISSYFTQLNKKSSQISIQKTNHKDNTEDNTPNKNTTNSNKTPKNFLEVPNTASRACKISHRPRRHTYNDGFAIDNGKEAMRRESIGNKNVQPTVGETRAEKHIQTEKEIDNVTNDSNKASANHVVDSTVTRKPLKICNRRLTYHNGITFNVQKASIERSGKNSNAQKTAGEDNVQDKTFVTDAEIHTHQETRRDTRVQTVTGKTCGKIRLEKIINSLSKTAVTKTHTHAEIECEKTTRNTIFEDTGTNTQYLIEQDKPQKTTSVSNANNTQREIDETTTEEKLFKLYKCFECNINFLTASTCYKHMSNHKPKDPTECSKCNDCGFVFTNYSLGKHKRDHCPKDNIDKVLVEEYRLNMKDNKTVIEVYHITFNVQRQYNGDKGAVSVTEIVHSENIACYEGGQLNANGSLHYVAANEDKENTDEIENNTSNELQNIRDFIRKSENERKNTQPQNLAKETEGQSKLKSNEMPSLLVSNEEAESISGGQYNTEDSAKSNNIVSFGIDNIVEVSSELTNTNEENEVQAVNKRDGGDSTVQHSTYLEFERHGNALMPNTNVEAPTVSAENQSSELTKTKKNEENQVQDVNHRDGSSSTVQHPTYLEIKRHANVLMPNTNVEAPTISAENQIITNSVTIELHKTQAEINDINGNGNIDDELNNHDDSSTEKIREFVRNYLKDTEDENNVQNNEKVKLFASNKVIDQQKENERQDDALISHTNVEMPTVIKENQIITSSKSLKIHEKRDEKNDCTEDADEELNNHNDSTPDNNAAIAAIIKSETITEENETQNASIRNRNNETFPPSGEYENIFGGLNRTHDVVQIFNSYFEEHNVVTVIDSDDDTDCQVVNSETNASSRNTKQRNKQALIHDDNSNFSDQTLVLDFDENPIFSVPDSQEYNIKTEFNELEISSATTPQFEIKRENTNECSFSLENVKTENEVTHGKNSNKRRKIIRQKSNIVEVVILDSDDDDDDDIVIL